MAYCVHVKGLIADIRAWSRCWWCYYSRKKGCQSADHSSSRTSGYYQGHEGIFPTIVVGFGFFLGFFFKETCGHFQWSVATKTGVLSYTVTFVLNVLLYLRFLPCTEIITNQDRVTKFNLYQRRKRIQAVSEKKIILLSTSIHFYSRYINDNSHIHTNIRHFAFW